MPLSRAMSHNLFQEICAATVAVRWAESWCNAEAIRLDISDSDALFLALHKHRGSLQTFKTFV